MTPSQFISVGKHLHVVMLKLQPNDDKFPTDEKIYYDIVVDDKNLKSLGLTQGKFKITYIHRTKNAS